MKTQPRYDVEMAIEMTRRSRGNNIETEGGKGEGRMEEKEISVFSNVVIKYPHVSSLIMVVSILYVWFFVLPLQPYGPVLIFALFTSILFTQAHKDRLKKLLHTQHGRRSMFLFLIFFVMTYVLIRTLGGTSVDTVRFDDDSERINMNLRGGSSSYPHTE